MLLENPSHVFVAFQGEEVAKTLEAASEAQNTHGGTLADISAMRQALP